MLLQPFDSPELEARLLLLSCTKRTEEQFFAEPDYLIPLVQEKKFFSQIKKRLKGIPLAYLTGEKEFWGLPFKVDASVLIPRPETELLVEKVLEKTLSPDPVIVDIGTGSGNIAISVAKHLGGAHIYATDISEQALTIARSNAQQLQVTEVTFILGDLFVPLKTLGLENQCDFIVSNPPYISQAEWEELPPGIKEHEPRLALVPGETGLEMIKKIVLNAGKYLKPEGYLLLEIGYGQDKPVQELLQSQWEKIECFCDLAGIPRVLIAQKRIV